MTSVCSGNFTRSRTPSLRQSKLARGNLTRGARVVRAVASAQEQTQQQVDVKSIRTWYAVISNAEFMLNDVQNESLAEQLREKKRFYEEKGAELDFFLICEPAWLDSKFPKEAKQVMRPCMALVTADKVWSKFMKLRLDRVLEVKLEDIGYDELIKCGASLPEFEPPAKWLAPYSPYTPKWWEVFMPGKL